MLFIAIFSHHSHHKFAENVNAKSNFKFFLQFSRYVSRSANEIACEGFQEGELVNSAH